MQKKLRIVYTYSILLVVFLFACSSPKDDRQVAEPVFSQSPTPTVEMATAEPDFSPTGLPDSFLVIEGQPGDEVFVKVGQVFQIKRPGFAEEWQIAYDESLFALLTPAEKVRSPGKEGWTFQAIAPGQGNFVFQSIPVCEGPIPCPMMPMQVELLVRVR